MFTEYFDKVVTLLRERGVTQIPDQYIVKDHDTSGKTPLESADPSGGGVQGTNRTPSKRTNPAVFPIHRYPSAVCTMAVGIPLNTPSCSRHDVCAYCDVRRTGS